MKSTVMRKLPLFSAVLCLFLLVPASITWAQITKTLNGTVRYESGMSETKISTPNGDVLIKLPQSMSGAVITGTVSTEPAGKSDKEKNKNLEELLKLVVMLEGQKISMPTTPTNFDWLTHLDLQSRTTIQLLNVSGTKVAELSLPPVLSAPAIEVWRSDRTPLLTTPSNVLVKGDVLNVYTNQQFKPGEKFILTNSKGQQFILKPICLSSQQAVLNVPEEAGAGNYTVRQEGVDQPLLGNNTENTGFKLIDFSLSSPNTNLRNGQTSSVTLAIDTKDPGETDSNEFLVFTVDVKNLTPAVVDMAGGNVQVINFPLNNDRQNLSAWQMTRTITGIKPGNFSVSATLHEDYNTLNDPFRPQLNVLKTPEDFNAWANALKKDLTEYAAIQNNDEMGKVIRTNTQRAIDNLPVCASPDQLDESKAVAYSLLRSVNVPKGAANTWLSGYEAFKTTLASAASGLTDKSNLADLDIIRNGVDFMERLSYRSKDLSMTQDVINARELINTFETGETKENLNQLNQALHSLSSRADKKIMTATTVNKIWKLSDVLFSTYCMNKRSKDGIDPVKSMIGYLDPVKKILHVKPEYQQQVLNSLKAISLGNGSYKISTVTATLKPVTYSILFAPLILANIEDSWINELDMWRKSSDTSKGTYGGGYRDSNGTWYIFFINAKCETSRYYGYHYNYSPANTSACKPLMEIYSRENKYEGRHLGLYYQRIRRELATCIKGTGFCTEVLKEIGVFNTYSDNNCTMLKEVSRQYGFSCL